jgi:hypothetical protein
MRGRYALELDADSDADADGRVSSFSSREPFASDLLCIAFLGDFFSFYSIHLQLQLTNQNPQ